MRTTLIPILLGLLAASALSCSSTPEIQYYQFAFETQTTSTATDQDGVVLGVDYLVPDSAYDDSRMVYRTSNYRLGYDHYHRWSAPPGVLVTDFLRRAYQRSGKFRAVVAGVNPNSDAVLRGRLVAIEEVETGSKPLRVRVILDLQLRDTRSNRILWTDYITREQPVGTSSREELARAFSKVLIGIVDETAAQLHERTQAALTQRKDDERRRKKLYDDLGIKPEGDAGAPPPETPDAQPTP